jgi:hypothetical protein
VTLNATNDYQTVDLLSNFKADGGVQQSVTVARTHLLVAVTSAVVAGDSFSFGLLRGQASDVGVNIAGAPTPVTFPYDDWVWWSRYSASSVTSGAVYSHLGATNTLKYDIKAMRRLEELQMNYNLVLENAGTAAAIDFSITGRILLMLP